MTEPQIDQFVESALLAIKIDIEARGFRWEHLYNLEKLKLAINYKAVAMASLALVKDDNDRFMIRYREFEEKSNAIIQGLELPYDKDKDGKPDARMSIAPQNWKVLR